MANSTNSSFSNLRNFINKPKVKFPLILGFFLFYPYLHCLDKVFLYQKTHGIILKLEDSHLETKYPDFNPRELYVVQFIANNQLIQQPVGENLYFDPSGAVAIWYDSDDKTSNPNFVVGCFGVLYQEWALVIAMGGVILTCALWWSIVSDKS